MNWNLFLSTFALIFIAELPDKTAFATLMMANEGSLVALFFGAALAFFIQCLIAVTAGGYLSHLPKNGIELGTGLLFLGFAVLSLKRAKENNQEREAPLPSSRGFIKSAIKSFSIIFLAELGDLTQLATASLAAKYQNRTLILCASVLALWSVTLIALILGKKIQSRISPSVFHLLAALTMGSFGIYFIFESIGSSFHR